MPAITQELVTLAKAGDPKAIDQLLRSVQGDIRRYARHSCRSASDIEDAVQETLFVLYRSVGTLRDVGAISGWLFRIVHRFCIRLTLRSVGIPYDDEAVAIERHFARVPKNDLRLDVARAIEALPPHYREVVIMRDMEERTINEIAEALGLTRESAKARLHRARALLREYLVGEEL